MNLTLTKGRSDRDANPQLPGQEQRATQLRRLPSSVPQEGTKPHGHMRTLFTPNTPYGQNQLRHKCPLARTGAVWCKRETSRHNRRSRGEDNPPAPGRRPAGCPARGSVPLGPATRESNARDRGGPHEAQTSGCKMFSVCTQADCCTAACF